MSKHNQNPFKWRHFQPDIILLCIRWYLRYSLSYRDLEEMMLGRGLHVDHTTIYRWVQHYAPELERRCRPHVKPTTDSWRVDETYIKVKNSESISIELLIHWATRSTSSSAQREMLKRPSIFFSRHSLPLILANHASST